MTTSQLMPALIVPLVAWRIYTRVRRNIGRQPFRPKRTVTGAILFSVLVVLIAVVSAKYPSALAALGGGLLIGIPLAVLGLRLTKFESLPTGKFFTPNTYLGVSLTLLFVGRMAYRTTTLLAAAQSGVVPPQPAFQSPLTTLMFGLIAGYYITFNLGVLKRANALPAPVAG